MRIEHAATPLGGSTDSVRCGGFWVVWLDGRPAVRLASGDRRLSPGVIDAVLSALGGAPDLLARSLRLRAPKRPWERVEVSLAPGSRIGGEAGAFGSGCIKLFVGEEASAADAARIARHEALHLLLAASLRGGETWCEPDLAFADWIVRGIEAWPGAEMPRFAAPLPGLLDPPPPSRVEVQRRLAWLDRDPAAARRYFGGPLCDELQRIGPSEQDRLWLVEAALGTHYLEAAGRLWAEDADALRPILLDDWLLDYQRYARGVANPPEGAGHLWRLSEAGWSREPLVRLSIAAQALQGDDHRYFTDGAAPHDPVVWKNRGRVRLPLVATASGARRPPLQAFRAVLREVPPEEGRRALALVEDAARGCEGFEARALWPRILARLLAGEVHWPELPEVALPAVQVMDLPEIAAAWSEAASALRELPGERGAWVPRVLPPAQAATLLAAPPPASILLVHGAPPSPTALLAARELAARIPIRGALFAGSLAAGAAWELLPDLDDPVDPRYREGAWQPGPAPDALGDLVRLVDEATRGGEPTTPLSHLLSISAVGVEECHSPRAPASAPRARPR